jgi:hypothetical protein
MTIHDITRLIVLLIKRIPLKVFFQGKNILCGVLFDLKIVNFEGNVIEHAAE